MKKIKIEIKDIFKIIVSIFFLFTLSVSFFFCFEKFTQHKKKSTIGAEEIIKNTNNGVHLSLKNTYNPVVEKSLKSVVSVKVTKIESLKGVMNDLFKSQFDRLSMDENLDIEDLIPPSMIPKKRRISVYGSGFLISEDGLLVTNYHVIENAKSIKVSNLNGVDFIAKIVGVDPLTDIALLKIKSKQKFTSLQFASSKDVKVGDSVLALGNPFNLDGTVTSGIVSSLGRSLGKIAGNDFIQTDAAINSGNSGGPMIDLEGNVIGINTAIISPSGGSVGIGFAIPADRAKNIIDQIKSGKSIKRGKLGVLVQPVNDDFAEALSTDDNGALIAEVEKDSNAYNKGIKPGDVIISVNGIRIKTFNDLPSLVSNFKPGEVVNLEIFRFGEKKNFKITLKERQNITFDDKDKEFSSQEKNEIIYYKDIGVKDVSDRIKAFYRLPSDTEGVIVFHINNIRTIEQGQLQLGDVITKINKNEVKNKEDFLKAIKSIKRKNAVFYLKRDGVNLILAISINE